jgi:hypothetical protein
MSDVFAGIVSDRGYGFYESRAGWDSFCTPTHPVHILMIDSKNNTNNLDVNLNVNLDAEDGAAQGLRKDVYVPFWANHNR